MKKFAPLLLALLLLSGCGRFIVSEEVRAPEYEYDMMGEAMPGADRAMEDSKMIMDESGYAAGVEQKVIKTGTLSLHMESVRDSVDVIKANVSLWGGDVTNSSVTRSGNSYYASLTVRVPSDQFETAMAGLKGLALYTESEYTNADNITEVYMDLEARLNNLKAEEEQYLAILEKAVTVEETLQVTDYLSNVRYEIESAEGQLKYYDTNVDYSSINLSLTEDESAEAAQETWRPESTFNDAVSDWVIFLQQIADSAIYLVIFGWPLILLGVAYAIWRRTHRKKRK